MAGATLNPAKATVTFDSSDPVIPATDAGAPEIRLTTGDSLPLDGPQDPAMVEWDRAFQIVFTVTDEGGEVDPTTIKFESGADGATDDEVSFGAARGLGSNMFAVTVTPKSVTKTETEATEVTITISVYDKAGNSGFQTVSAMLAPRTAGEEETPATGLVPGDTRRDVTEEAEFELSGMLASNSFALFVPVANDDIDGEAVIDKLPDIQRFFARGGTISLVGGAKNSVVISEIMWGLNKQAAVPKNAGE